MSIPHLVKIKNEALRGNRELGKSNLTKYSWGNLSVIDPKRKYIAIKPSGIPYNKISINDIVVTDINGKTIDGKKLPSTDLKTHIFLYKSFKNINSICHTHSKYATIFCQANKSIKCLGTTHADEFSGDIPITRKLKKTEIMSDYVGNTGKVIFELFKLKKLDPLKIKAVLVSDHAPFVWGSDYKESIKYANILEIISEMAFKTLMLNKSSNISTDLRKYHYNRKYGENSHYGQKSTKKY